MRYSAARCMIFCCVQALTAMRQGADLRGMYLWTLVDNFEWHEAYNHHFGLYACDMGSPELERVPRLDSVATVKAIHAALPETVEEVRSTVGGLVERFHHPMCNCDKPVDTDEPTNTQEGNRDGADEPSASPEL